MDYLSTRLSHEVSLSLEGVAIICRSGDGYVNATQLCKAGKKEYSNYIKNTKSIEFLTELESALLIRRAELIKYENNGSADRATWVHPRVAINIAQWISPKFDVRVSAWVHELLVCGNVKYGLERADSTIIHDQLQQLEASIKNKDNMLAGKDMEIDSITQKCDIITQKYDSITQKYDSITIQHNIITIQNEKLQSMLMNMGYDLNTIKEDNKELNRELKVVHTELTSTKDLVVNIAERCVPVTNNNAIKEVYALFHVGNNHYYSMRVQQRSLHSSIKRYEKNNNVALKPVKEWICSPNAILLHHYIKEELSIKRNTLKIDGNDMYLSAECKIESLVRKIDRLHAIRY
jgi:hypothetical protein